MDLPSLQHESSKYASYVYAYRMCGFEQITDIPCTLYMNNSFFVKTAHSFRGAEILIDCSQLGVCWVPLNVWNTTTFYQLGEYECLLDFVKNLNVIHAW